MTEYIVWGNFMVGLIVGIMLITLVKGREFVSESKDGKGSGTRLAGLAFMGAIIYYMPGFKIGLYEYLTIVSLFFLRNFSIEQLLKVIEKLKGGN